MRFQRRRRGVVEAQLDEVEAYVLRTAVGELLELVESQLDDDADPLEAEVGLPTGEVHRPDDPALARLLPDAYRDDAAPGLDAAAASDEFRRYTESDLRTGKRADATAVLESLAQLGRGGRLRLDRSQADAWLRCLNDLRLVLGTRLEVTEDAADRQLPDDDPRAYPLQVYGWLGWLQESLLECLDPGGR